MSKARSTSFKKGQIANPNGRPKGSSSPLKKRLMELKNLAAEKVEEAFNDLWRDFKAGDPLAKQIYFKELVSMPKNWMNETIIVSSEEGLDRLEALKQALPQFNELTHDEVINEIRTLRQIEIDPISTLIDEYKTEETLQAKIQSREEYLAFRDEYKKRTGLGPDTLLSKK